MNDLKMDVMIKKIKGLNRNVNWESIQKIKKKQNNIFLNNINEE